jgi:phosphatidylglycerol:prolipoprotein diacylglycerol transferase
MVSAKPKAAANHHPPSAHSWLTEDFRRMYQILFHIPFTNIPIHGYGFMLFVAFIGCTLLAMYLARKQGIAADKIQDLALWLFVSGILGARFVYVIQYWDQFKNNTMAVFAIWDGGLVFYGSAIGGLLGFIGYYRTVMKPAKIRFWQMADIVAPCAALGLCLGRIGCLLNGCCYGGPACPDCPALSFPLPATPRYVMVSHGYQTPAGFLVKLMPFGPVVVSAVEADSAAAHAGLREGDVIHNIQGHEVQSYEDLKTVFAGWPRGVNVLNMKIERGGENIELSFVPWTIGLHPTQIYESISTGLLLFLLLSYFPFRRHDGEIFVLLMLGYSIHRFLDEAIRIDTDRYWLNLTLSQHLSIVVFIAAIILVVKIRQRPPDYGPKSAPPEEKPAPSVAPSQPALATEAALQD